MSELEKIYSFSKIEMKILNLWKEKEVFKTEKLSKDYKKDYLLFLPPPNITGTLHMGHALNATFQDILARFKRLKKFRTLWIPGIDHAGIATNRVVERELLKEGKTRFDLGKEEFLKRIWQWKEKYGSIILDQLRRLGASFDLSKTVFTMDEDYSLAVKNAFLHFFKKGLVFKKKRVINWCPQCQTSLSDLEIEYSQEREKLYFIRYPLAGQVGFITVATTRPETLLGDMAVAVNPKDKRYRALVGKKVFLPLAQREIPVIEDFAIDINFGTGAVKVTPGHDPLDYEISLRHQLEILKIIDERGKICSPAPLKYQGMEIEKARKTILDDLQEKFLLEKSEDILHNVPRCERCKTRIEFLPSDQWFLSMEKLKKIAIETVKKGKINFFPKRFENVYLDWLKNAKDWCLSRQIWWGHKIPLEGEEDVLDTWFSAGLWPLAALGWPKTKKGLKKLPSALLVTGRDIINLWVARMVFFTLEFAKKIPFKAVFITPTVLTKEGKRMSKSLGIGIDPLELIKKYGADAVRFGLIWQAKKRQDIRFSEEHL
ncbi:MAG: class I tRNA ligase family protein, partial [Minisyncoccales bacterium]